MVGANQFDLSNNQIINSQNGIVAQATGNNFNSIKCNVLDDIDNIGNLYSYNNENTQFRQNIFEGPPSSNIFLNSTTISNHIGAAENPAGNCFSSNISDIITLNSNQSFEYHYFDDANTENCQEPVRSGSYEKIKSFNRPNNCGGKVGIFNLIDPDGDGKNGFDPDVTNPPTCTNHIPKDSLLAEILNWINIVVNDGGDDPTTVQNEETTNSTPIRIEKEAVLDQWIRYAIYRSIDENDCAFIDLILSKFVTWKWQKQRFGHRLQCGDLDGALNLLNQMNSENQDVSYFKEVQNTNLKRINGLGEGNWISIEEIARLKLIAESKYPSAAYARSLYQHLTGEILSITIPDASEYISSSQRHSTNIEQHDEVLLFPNPTEHKIIVQSIEAINQIKIVNLLGQTELILSGNQNTLQVDISALKNGVYFIEIKLLSGKTQSKTFVKM